MNSEKTQTIQRQPSEVTLAARKDVTPQQQQQVQTQLETVPEVPRQKIVSAYNVGAPVRPDWAQKNISKSSLGEFMRGGPEQYATRHGIVNVPNIMPPYVQKGTDIHSMIEELNAGKYDPSKYQHPMYEEHRTHLGNYANFRKHADVLAAEQFFGVKQSPAEMLGLKPHFKEETNEPFHYNLIGKFDQIIRFKPHVGELGGKNYLIDLKTSRMGDPNEVINKALHYKSDLAFYRFLAQHAGKQSKLPHIDGYGAFFTKTGSFIPYDNADLDQIFDRALKGFVENLHGKLATQRMGSFFKQPV